MTSIKTRIVSKVFVAALIFHSGLAGLQALALNGPAGHLYEISDPSHASTPQPQAPTQDKQKSEAALEAFKQADGLRLEGSRESLKNAVVKYDEALLLYRSAADRRGEGMTLNRIGLVYDELGEKQKGLDYFNQALPLWRAVGNRAGEATTLNNIGLVYDELGENQKALDYYNQALPLWRAVGNRAAEAAILNNIGRDYVALRDRQKALESYNQSILIFRAIGDHAGEGTTLSITGLLYKSLGEKRKALEVFNQALPLLQAVDSRADLASTLFNLALIYDSLGEMQKALEFYNEALPVLRASGNRTDEVVVVNNMGVYYSSLGERRKALEFYEQALSISQAIADRKGEAAALDNIASIYDWLGEKQKALEFYGRALPLRRALNDRGGEATTLGFMGGVYESLDNRKALELYNLALPLFRSVGDQSGEASTLDRIGSVCRELGENQKALGFYDQALLLRRAISERSGEASTLANIGLVYSSLGEKRKALEFNNQALTIFRELKDSQDDEATVLNNIGLDYSSLGEKQKALEFFDQSLQISRAVKDRRGEGATLNNIAHVYYSLGEMQKALEFLNKAQVLFRALGDRITEADMLNNIGVIYNSLDGNEKALDFYNQALLLRRLVHDRPGEAITLSNIGGFYKSHGDKQKALEFFNQALPIHRSVGDRRGEAGTLDGIGVVYYSLDEKQKALEFLIQALALHREVNDLSGEGTTLTSLMMLWKSLQKPRLAILYGKRAVNIYQQLRANISGLDKALQKTFLHSNEDTYRILADLLISRGRLPEAQQVLGLLKEQEYFDFVQRDASVSALLKRSDLTPEEVAAVERYNEVADQITKLAGEFSALKARRASPDDPRYQSLKTDIEAANRTFQVMLRQLADEFGKEPEKGKEIVKELQENKGLQSDLKKWGSGTVSLYTIVGTENYHVIITTPTLQVAREASPAIKAVDLNKLILEFREAIQDPKVDPRPLARQLYKILIAPVEKDLEAAGAKTLVWSLDGTLRYLPIAALHDGQQYFVERYQNVIITLASRTRLNDQPRSDWHGLGLGVSKGVVKEWGTFRPLPSVPAELRGIIREANQGQQTAGVLPGRVMLDETFTAKAMEAALGEGRYPLVHIASHFMFKPGNETNSFLLLGDGNRLTLDKIRVTASPFFEGVELLTLSACDTATGGEANGKEVEGFAVLAQEQGAQAVLATLWPVADESTKLLMERFYQYRLTKAGASKVEALRQAQLALLRPQIAATGVGSRAAGSADQKSSAAPFKADPNAPFAHPYFWAPFILIGNWR